jgi:hypothetical protein
MNKIQQAYEMGLRIREEDWYDTFWIKKHSNTECIDEMCKIWNLIIDFDFALHPEKWEIWHEDAHLFKEPTDIKAQIENHINQIEQLLKQL